MPFERDVGVGRDDAGAARERAETLLADLSDLARLGLGLILPVTLQGVMVDAILAWAEASSARHPHSDGATSTALARLAELDHQLDPPEADVRADLELAITEIVQAGRALAETGSRDSSVLLGWAITKLLDLSAARMMLDSARSAHVVTQTVRVDVPSSYAPEADPITRVVISAPYVRSSPAALIPSEEPPAARSVRGDDDWSV